MQDQPTDLQYGYCHCGCGQKTRVSPVTHRDRGWVKGQPRRFVNGHNGATFGRRKPNRYKVRDCGYITPCWVWQLALDEHGYGRERNSFAYRRMFEQHHGPVPAGLELDHLCCNRACVNPDHLEPVTKAENQRRGLGGKLTPELIATIYRRAHAGEVQTALALEYGIDQTTVSAIKLGKRGADVTGDIIVIGPGRPCPLPLPR